MLMLIQALVFMLKAVLKVVLTPTPILELKLKRRLISRLSLKHASKQFQTLAVKLILILKVNVTVSARSPAEATTPAPMLAKLAPVVKLKPKLRPNPRPRARRRPKAKRKAKVRAKLTQVKFQIIKFMSS